MASDSPAPRAPKPLWEVMGRSAPAQGDNRTPQNEAGEVPASSGAGDSARETASGPDRALAELIGIPTEGVADSARRRAAVRRSSLSLSVRAAVALGGLSIPLAALAVVHAPWSRLPAMGAGFAAIVLGLMAFSDSTRGKGSALGRRLALAGLLAGVIGMFLGPMVIAPLFPPSRDREASVSAPDEADADYETDAADSP